MSIKRVYQSQRHTNKYQTSQIAGPTGQKIRERNFFLLLFVASDLILDLQYYVTII